MVVRRPIEPRVWNLHASQTSVEAQHWSAAQLCNLWSHYRQSGFFFLSFIVFCVELCIVVLLYCSRGLVLRFGISYHHGTIEVVALHVGATHDRSLHYIRSSNQTLHL